MNTNNDHSHTFTDKRVKVLLHKYRPDDGKQKPIVTQGFDILHKRVCSCGYSETTDLERTVLA